METKALHIILDLWDCEYDIGDDDGLLKILIEAAEVSGSKVVGLATHRYEPYGFSAVVLVSESHLSIHTWPEHNYVAIDIYTCGRTDPQAAAEYIIKKLKPSKISSSTIQRG